LKIILKYKGVRWTRETNKKNSNLLERLKNDIDFKIYSPNKMKLISKRFFQNKIELTEAGLFKRELFNTDSLSLTRGNNTKNSDFGLYTKKLLLNSLKSAKREESNKFDAILNGKSFCKHPKPLNFNDDHVRLGSSLYNYENKKNGGNKIQLNNLLKARLIQPSFAKSQRKRSFVSYSENTREDSINHWDQNFTDRSIEKNLKQLVESFTTPWQYENQRSFNDFIGLQKVTLNERPPTRVFLPAKLKTTKGIKSSFSHKKKYRSKYQSLGKTFWIYKNGIVRDKNLNQDLFFNN